MKGIFVSILALSLFAALSTPAFADDPGSSDAIAHKIANAVSTCKTNPKLDGCTKVMEFADAVDLVNSAHPAAPAAAAANPPKPAPARPVPTFAPDKDYFTFAAASDTKTGTVAYTKRVKSDKASPVDTWTFSASTPVNQDAGYQNFATLDGLSKSTSLGIAYASFHGTNGNPAPEHNSKEYQDKCVAILNEIVKADPSLEKELSDYRQHASCDAGLLLEDYVNANTFPSGPAPGLRTRLTDLKEDKGTDAKPIWYWGFNVKYGFEQHTYFDATSLAKSSAKKYPLQLGVSGGFFATDHSAVELSYAYQHGFTDGRKDGQTEILCPLATTGPVNCVSGYVGAPAKKDKHLIGVGYKLILPESGWIGVPFAINPAVTYDAASHEYGFQFPLYIMPNGSKYLTGGIRYDWTSRKHQSVLGIFVSSAFCLVPGKTDCASGGGKD